MIYTYRYLERGNIGTIKEVCILTYRGAAKKTNGYKVIVNVSVFETLENAKNDLRKCAFIVDGK